MKCSRCSSDVDPFEWYGFKCSRCDTIKIERTLLEPIEHQIIDNFQNAKNLKYGGALNHLYLFGSYLKGESQCSDIDFLITYDKSKLDQYIDWYLTSYTKRVLERCYDIENDDISMRKLRHFLDDTEFWDFRRCSEYPDCLRCFEDEHCDYLEVNYNDLHSYGVHTYCLEKCRSRAKVKLGIPECYWFPNTCSWQDDDNNFRNAMIRSQMLESLMAAIKKDADPGFTRSGLTVKVVLLNSIESINEFIEGYPNLNLQEPGAIKQIA